MSADRDLRGLSLRTNETLIYTTTTGAENSVEESGKLTTQGFQRLFLEAVDDTFSSLGDSAKQAIYFHLETKFKMPRNEIPCRVEDFEKDLQRIFGAGTRFLEILIMKRLYEAMGPKGRIIKWEDGKEFKFLDYVKVAEQTFSHAKKKD